MARLDWYIRANLKLRHLQLLVALDDLRNVGRAAAYLNITQPAVSRTLSAMETGLRATLFERTPTGVEPTEEGVYLIRLSRDLLSRLAVAGEELLDLSEGRIARINLGVLPAAAVTLVPRMIAQLQQQPLAVTISVREGTMDSLLPALRSGDLDLTVGVLPERPLGVEFESEVLGEDPIVAVVRRDHPLTRLDNPGWKDLAGYALVLPPPGTFTRGPIDASLAHFRVAVPRQSVLESVSTMTNVGTLQLTDSVGFLSRGLALHFAALGMLNLLPISAPTATMRVGLIWRSDRRRTKAQELVRRLFRESLQEPQPDAP
jgi:DNA-binding transcriptional LysR family regulator